MIVEEPYEVSSNQRLGVNFNRVLNPKLTGC
jgi:hypothetical protein